MRTALYVRVSTPEQNPALQRAGWHTCAPRAGPAVVATHTALGASGRTPSRPQLPALMRAARHRACGGVLVWTLDRLARSVQAQLYTACPFGKAMVTVSSATAELESDLSSERVKAGMAAPPEPLAPVSTTLAFTLDHERALWAREQACTRRGPHRWPGPAAGPGRAPARGRSARAPPPLRDTPSPLAQPC